MVYLCSSGERWLALTASTKRNVSTVAYDRWPADKEIAAELILIDS